MAKISIINEYLALRSVTAAPGLYIALSGRVFVDWGIGRPNATGYKQSRSSVTVYSARLRTVRDRPSAVSQCRQSRSTVNRVYDSKARRYAEDNRTESNCT